MEDIENVKKVAHLRNAYKIVKHIDTIGLSEEVTSRLQKWNLVFNAASAGSELDDFAKSLHDLGLFKDFDVIPYTTAPIRTLLVNSLIRGNAFLQTVLPSVFGYTLTKEESRNVPPVFVDLCSEDFAEHKSAQIMVNALKFSQAALGTQEAQNYMSLMRTKIWPHVGTRYGGVGLADDGYWDAVAYVHYKNREMLCYMMQSKELNSVVISRKPAATDNWTFLTTKYH